MDKDQILNQLDSIDWDYATSDPEACNELEARICRQGRVNGLIPYSNLVSGIGFNLPSINGGKSKIIDTHNWQHIDRRIIGDFLGYISYISYKKAGFMASALVIKLNGDMMPSDIFFKWMESLDILSDLQEKTIETFWINEVSKAHQWYRQNPKGIFN